MALQQIVEDFLRKKAQPALQQAGNTINNAVNSQFGQRLLYGPQAIQPVTKGLVQGVADTFKPFGNLLGEAAYQGTRFVSEPAYRRSVFGQAPQPGDIQALSQHPDTRLMSTNQLMSPANTIVSGGAATGKALLGTYALANPVELIKNAAISGGLDYGISRATGKSNQESLQNAGRAAGNSTVWSGVNNLTGGFQNSLVNDILPKGAGIIKRAVTRGLISGGLNAAESGVVTPLTEGRFATPEELLVAGGTGFIGGAGSEAVSATLNKVAASVKRLKPDISDQEAAQVARQFVRDEAGRFATQGAADLTKKKSYKGLMVSELRRDLGLPVDGNYDVPIGFQAKPINPSQGEKIRSTAYQDLLSQGLTPEQIAAKYPNSVPVTAKTPAELIKARMNPESGTPIGATLGDPTIPNEAQKLNVNKLNLDPQQKAQIRNLETDEPRVVLKNADVVTASDFTSGKRSPVQMEDTKQKLAQQLNSRQAVVSLENEFTNLKASGAAPEVLQKKIEDIAAQSKIARTEGTEAGRILQARNILADALATPMQKVFRLLDNAGVDQSKYTKDAASVDWNNAEQVVNFYRRYVPPTAGDWLDTIRYNSMLSSPNTHINNAFSNLINSAVVAPIEKTVTGGLDFIGSSVTGKQQTHFVGEAPAYAKGYVSSAGEAYKNFVNTLTGKNGIKNLDITSADRMPLGTEGRTGNLIFNYTLPTRALEAVDQFFTTLTTGGERAALNFKEGKGIKVNDLESFAQRKAAYRLFRSDLNMEGQGTVLNAIDGVTGLMQKARSSSNPILSTVAKFTLPFVKTPMNILKQGIEYSPAGLTTIPGAGDKTEQLSKAMIGTGAMAATAMLVASGRTTWSEPTDAKKKQAFRDAGMQPYSVKVGDQWVSYTKLPPALAYPIALVSALHDAQENKTIDQNSVDTILSAVAKSEKFYADQSYFKNISDFLASASGDPEKVASFFSNYPQQLVPWRAFLGWAARLIDPYQRKVNTDANYLEQQTQQLMTQIPGLSQKVPARTNEFGDPIQNQNRVLNAFSPLRITNENTDKADYYKQLKSDSLFNKNLDIVGKMAEQGKDIPPGIFDVNAAENDQKLAGVGPKNVVNQKLTAVLKKKIDAGLPLKQSELEKVYLSDFNSQPADTNYQKGLKEDQKFAAYSKISKDGSLSTEQKQYLIGKLGIKPVDAEYYDVASQSDTARYGYIEDQLKSASDSYTTLSNLRRTVNGKQVLTNDLIDQLYSDGSITKAEQKSLKAIQYDKLGNLKKSSSGTGSKAKVITDFAKIIKESRIKSPRIKSPQLKGITTGTTRSVRIQTPNLPEFRYKGKPFTLKKK